MKNYLIYFYHILVGWWSRRFTEGSTISELGTQQLHIHLSQFNQERVLALQSCLNAHIWDGQKLRVIFVPPLRLGCLTLKPPAFKIFYLPSVPSEVCGVVILDFNQLHKIKQFLITKIFDRQQKKIVFTANLKYMYLKKMEGNNFFRKFARDKYIIKR